MADSQHTEHIASLDHKQQHHLFDLEHLFGNSSLISVQNYAAFLTFMFIVNIDIVCNTNYSCKILCHIIYTHCTIMVLTGNRPGIGLNVS